MMFFSSFAEECYGFYNNLPLQILNPPPIFLSGLISMAGYAQGLENMLSQQYALDFQ